jgi:hypothetical protein
MQFVNTYTFGELSSIGLVLSQGAPSVDAWFSAPARSAIFSFAYGVSPF